MTILSRNEQRGRSMVEMLGVLAIIGVLSVGGISGYSKAMAKYKLTKAQDQITMLLMNIRTAYATSPDYNGLNAQVAAEYKLAPSEMVSGTGTTTKLYGAFGGEVKVGYVDGHTNYFYIGISNLGKEACRTLLSSDWGADGLAYITAASGGDVTAPKTVACTKTSSTTGLWCPSDLPVSVSSAASTCGGEINNIVWVYY
jgi:type II secretory pathway pseudopilin PulG